MSQTEGFQEQTEYPQDVSYHIVNDIEQPTDYASLQTAQYNNGYNGTDYLAQHQYQNMTYIERTGGDNSPTNSFIYRDDPNLASSRYQVSVNSDLFLSLIYQVVDF